MSIAIKCHWLIAGFTGSRGCVSTGDLHEPLLPFLRCLWIGTSDCWQHCHCTKLSCSKKTAHWVLVSLTGSWSTLGRNTESALEIGAARINAQSDARHAGYRIELFVRDTRLVPELALEALKELHRKGVTVVIGPQTSAELALLRPYADARHIPLISQASTASSLAIAGDNIFRFCPGDTLEAQAITALMWHDGIRTLVPLWRGDAGNDGLHDSSGVPARFR